MNTSNPTTRADRRYLKEFAISMTAYAVVLSGSVWSLNHGVHGPLMYLVAVVPVLPLIGVFTAVVRYLQRTDEFVRQTQITSLAISGGITAMAAVTYGFLENVGLPKPNVWYTFLVFTTVWGIAQPIVRRYYQ